MSKIRSEVIKAFRKLHRTRQRVFDGDVRALVAGRKEINDRFKENMKEKDENNIKKMLQLAVDVDKELRLNVIQARKKKDNVYELRITKETTKLDNVMFNPGAVLPTPKRRGKADSSAAGGCSGAGKNKESKPASQVRGKSN